MGTFDEDEVAADMAFEMNKPQEQCSNCFEDTDVDELAWNEGQCEGCTAEDLG